MEPSGGATVLRPEYNQASLGWGTKGEAGEVESAPERWHAEQYASALYLLREVPQPAHFRAEPVATMNAPSPWKRSVTL